MAGTPLSGRKYREYPEYKNSGVEWLGNIPKSWFTIKFGLTNSCAILGGNYSSGEGEEGLPLIKMGNLGRGHINLNKIEYLPKNESYDKSFLLKDGDFLFNTRNSLNLVGKVSIWRSELPKALYNSNILKISFDKNMVKSTSYMNYLFNSELGLSQLSLIAKGTTSVAAIYYKELKSLVFMLPPINEQQKIANFLDHETAKIDTLIAKQEKLIELLKEKRQAVISQAVTRGLNPDAPMKDSGVEWLGEVPEHWRVTRNKHLLKFVTSGSRGWAEYYSDEGNLFFRIANLTRDTIEPKLISIQNVKPPIGGEGERSKIENGDLLISITADLGSVCIADDSIAGGYVSQHVSLSRPDHNVGSSRWLAYYILSDASKEQLLGAGYGGTKVQLSLADIRDLVVPMPPQNEQIEISDYLDSCLLKFADLMTKANKQVQLLHERKTALISAAVTGKIDVRDYQYNG